MPTHKELLIEILTEELPALPFLKEWRNIPAKWEQALKTHNLSATSQIHFTPRRIAIIARDVPIKTAPIHQEFFGPPIAIAYVDGDKNKGFSKAGESFLKKVGLESDVLKSLAQNSPLQTTIKDGKEVLFVQKTIDGIATQEVLGKIVRSFLKTLNFGKTMRWGTVKEGFIRPIRNIAILFGDTTISITEFDQEGKGATLLHRDSPKGNQWVEIKSVQNYLDMLASGGVLLDEAQRRATIIEQIRTIETHHQIQVELDEALLDEVVAITEYPSALLGHFDKRFLALPSEVILTSMKENQRYFGIYKNGKLYNGFIVVANSLCKDTAFIINGNQKVLKARLSDAEFFYQNDLKTKLEPESLAQIAFVEGLGSMFDKTQREVQIGSYLAKCYNQAHDIITTSLRYAKVDLLSEMVGEFPELQGIMGYYYALPRFGEQIASAIKEQYLPNGEDSPLPNNALNAIVAMSIKLDNLLALFSIGKIPSGSKDPFALRRAANGVLRILLAYNLAFDLDSTLKDLVSVGGYQIDSAKLTSLRNFLLDRLESILGLDSLIFRSVSKGASAEILQIKHNAQALAGLLLRDDKDQIVSVFKRVANITKDIDSGVLATQKLAEILAQIATDLLHTPQERDLYDALRTLESKHLQDPKALLEALFSLREVLEKFFENVMVNVDDPILCYNRKLLIYAIYAEFRKIGDLKELAI